MRFNLRNCLTAFVVVSFLMWANLPISSMVDDYEIAPPHKFNAVRSFLFLRGWPVPIWWFCWGNILGIHIKEWHFWGTMAFNFLIQSLTVAVIMYLSKQINKFARKRSGDTAQWA